MVSGPMAMSDPSTTMRRIRSARPGWSAGASSPDSSVDVGVACSATAVMVSLSVAMQVFSLSIADQLRYRVLIPDAPGGMRCVTPRGSSG